MKVLRCSHGSSDFHVLSERDHIMLVSVCCRQEIHITGNVNDWNIKNPKKEGDAP